MKLGITCVVYVDDTFVVAVNSAVLDVGIVLLGIIRMHNVILVNCKIKVKLVLFLVFRLLSLVEMEVPTSKKLNPVRVLT